MNEKIVSVFENNDGRALTIEELNDKLKLKGKEEVKEFTETLNKMCADGTVYYTKKNKYVLFKDSHLLKGVMSLTSTGNGFAKVDGYSQDLFIDKKYTGGAISKDLVALELDKRNPNHARVIKILNRNIEDIVGEFYTLNGKNYVKRLGQKESPSDILIPDDYTNGAVTGHYVIARPIEGKRGYVGEIIRITGHKNNPGDDILAYVYKYKFHNGFSKEVEEELKKIPSYVTQEVFDKEIERGRVDLTDEEIFTIDGDDTKDIDDAVGCKILPDNNYQLTIPIADVSYYVKEDSAIDKEACARGTSVYFPGGSVPMLSPKLSNGICSLNPNTIRLTLSARMEIDDKGQIVDYRIFESIIKSRIQMTYNKVNDILDKNIIDPDYAPYVKSLRLMKTLADKLEAKMIARGYIEFETDECKIIVDENCVPVSIQRRSQGTGEKIIEVFMIAANETVASDIFYKGLPGIYRVHDVPKEEKFDKFIKFLASRGVVITGIKKRNHEIRSEDFQKIVSIINKHEASAILNKMAIRTQRKAEYTDYNIGHFGLGSECYAHFTSPIRRYPDLILHRLVKDYANNLNTETIAKWETRLPALAQHCSEREKASEDFERDVDKMKKSEYMEKHIGEEYNGLISGVHDFGLFVELDNTIEGLAKINNLPKDSYDYNEDTLTLRGKKPSNRFSFGDRVDVKVIGASKDTSTVDFMVLSKDKDTKSKDHHNKIKNKTKKKIKKAH